MSGQLGLEATPAEYVAAMVEVFREVRRVVSNDGTLWLNLGDSYAAKYRQSGADHAGALSKSNGALVEKGYKRDVPAGLKEKDLVGIPWRVAFALQEDGWYLRSDIIWSKPNPMPESVTDRPTKAHEYLFLLSKSERYFYDAEGIAEPVAVSQVGRVRDDVVGGTSHVERGQHSKGGSYKQDGHGRRHAGFNGRWDASDGPERETRNARSVWEIATAPFPEAHFATFPPELPRRCIAAGSAKGDTVLDPFGGAGTTGLVADRLGRSAVLIELNPKYAAMAERRIHNDAPLFANVSTQENQ